jgi:hypothetical protein
MAGKELHLYPNSPKPDATTRSVMNLEVTVDDYKPQTLRTIRPYGKMTLQIPCGLNDEASMVLMLLFDCFDKAGEVKEGLVGDLLWGFAQIHPPVPPTLTLQGLRHLYNQNFIKFQAPDNSYVDFTSSQMERAFVRYQPSLLALVYEG